MELLKLMKLMYLAERESLKQFGEGIVGDRLVSMPRGPVMSLTYSHMNGELESAPGGWNSWIDARANHRIALQKSKAHQTSDDLLALSQADVDILEGTWRQFGSLSAFGLVDYTHQQCAEWQDPDGSMIPMKPEAVFSALGLAPEVAAAYVVRMSEQAKLQSVLRAVGQ